VINLPNPAWTDAAHRNGVKSLGCWFWPRTDDFEQLVTQAADGSFPVGDKLIEMADYFGFDGYFINQEGNITADQAARLHEMWRYMRQAAPAGFHLQWYDSLTTAGKVSYQNEFDAVNAPWIIQDGERYCSSTFLNYWWSQAKCNGRTTMPGRSDWIRTRPFLPGPRPAATISRSRTTRVGFSPRAANRC
jgi:endo-beta-N-acetylglucosaminidase D